MGAIKKGSTSVTVYVQIYDSTVTTGAGKTGLVYNSSGLVCYYVRSRVAAAALTLVTQTVAGAWSSGGFVEVDATNMPGLYRLDLSDAMCATGVNDLIVMLKGATGMAPVVLEIDLVAYDPQDAVRLGLTAMPNAAAGVSGGLATIDVNLRTAANVTALDGTLQTSIITAIWAALTSAMTTTGSIGKRVVDYLTGDIFARIGAPAGASVSADIAAVKTDTGNVATRIPGAITIASGVIEANLKQINGDSVAGNVATLTLKQLDIQNSAGTAVVAKSTGSNGRGMDIAGNGSGEGMKVKGGATGDGVYIECTGTGKVALHPVALGSTGAGINGEGTYGIVSAGSPLATQADVSDVASNLALVLDRIGAITGAGVNTILGFFKALLSKTASMPSDIGGTFDPATDSTEAIRDRGDAAWVTGGGGGGDATAANQTIIIGHLTDVKGSGWASGDNLHGRLDAAITTRSSHSAADIWAVGTRTLTSFGTLVSDITTAVWGAGTRTLTSFGTLVADTATAVWAAGTRTLTSFGTLVADTATAIWGAVTRTLTASSDSSGVTTLLTRIPGTVQPQTGDSFARLGAPAGASVSADVAAVKAETAAIVDDTGTSGVVVAAGSKAGYELSSTGNNAAADALLKRDWSSITGEAARSVLNALRFLRNKWTVVATTLSVKKEDDTTEAWSGVVTTDAASDPITGNDPS